MFRLALALCLGLASGAYAEENTKWFNVVQECMPLQDFIDSTVQRYGEQALFTAEGVTLGADGTPYTGGVMFLVNQETGTWTLGTLYGDGTACINAAGTQFEPYTR